MKKIIASALSLLMVLGIGGKVLAVDSTKLTPEEKAAREKFTSVYMEKMEVLVGLRTETKAAVEANNTLTQQIKDKLKVVNKEDIQAKIAKVKEVEQKIKELTAEAKKLHEQRAELVKKFQEAVKNRDTATMADLRTKITDLNSKIEAIRQQIQSNKETIKPIVEELKAIKEGRKDKSAQIKPLQEQVKALHKKIVDEEAAKNKLWETFRQNVKAKNYEAALTTFDNIIAAKKQILADLKAKTELLKQILAILG